MNIADILGQLGGIQSIARELGIDEREARAGMEALAPAVLGGMKRQAQARPSGLEDLIGMLGGLGGGGLLDEVLAPRPTDVARGDDVLGQIFGTREVSRTVTGHAAGRTGLDPALLKKMLPMIAMLVAGYLSRQRATNAPSAGSARPAGPIERGGFAGPQDLPNLGSLLDLDRDGNPLDDILDMAGKLLR